MAASATKTTAATSEPKKAAAPAKDPKSMNLAQKFVELRRACPEIVKKKHSDGVKYTFAKIFDVYELLAPAMNEWGVDWDIVKEVATRHFDNGDPMFFSTYIQHTKNGDRVVWVYEADLTLCWVNVDNPDETQEITLHALGTNDGGPDKAKGSAWTYCLKYYLFEKFNIDQGEDDPDNSDHGSDAPQAPQNGRQNAGNYRGGQTTTQRTNAPQNGSQGQQRTLSPAQMNRLYKKAEVCGMTKEAADKRILEKYGHQNPAEMTREQYDEICASLDAYAQQQNQGGQDNAQ